MIRNINLITLKKYSVEEPSINVLDPVKQIKNYSPLSTDVIHKIDDLERLEGTDQYSIIYIFKDQIIKYELGKPNTNTI